LEQFEAHLTGSALAPATVANYMADLRAFLRWCEKTVETVSSPLYRDKADIEEFCTYLREAKGQAPSTINRRIQALRKFYSLATAEGWIEENPAEQVPLLTEVLSDRSRSLTPQDVSQLLATVRQSSSHRASRDWVVVQLLLRAGLKLGELTTLELGDIHLDASPPHLVVRDGSGARGRLVPLETETCQALLDYLGRRQAAPGVPHVCVNRDGKPLSKRSIQRLLRRYAKAAGLEGLTTQALRYTYARKVYEKSGDVKTVARRLGHRHLATTIRYLRSSSEE
jgi:site-specific recombinase XerD